LSNVKHRINHQIRATEVRLIDENGQNVGVVPLRDALERALRANLDLIEISASANPPVAKITDYGKFQYDEKKKQKVAKAKTHVIEIKVVQVKVGTGEHDLALKAGKASQWLQEGHRVKVDLFLTGRSKYMEFNFLKERMDRILKLITEEYKIAEEPKKGPKGISMIIEKAR
jgi:translation initiation factor IF-3